MIVRTDDRYRRLFVKRIRMEAARSAIMGGRGMQSTFPGRDPAACGCPALTTQRHKRGTQLLGLFCTDFGLPGKAGESWSLACTEQG